MIFSANLNDDLVTREYTHAWRQITIVKRILQSSNIWSWITACRRWRVWIRNKNKQEHFYTHKTTRTQYHRITLIEKKSRKFSFRIRKRHIGLSSYFLIHFIFCFFFSRLIHEHGMHEHVHTWLVSLSLTTTLHCWYQWFSIHFYIVHFFFSLYLSLLCD